ncbi:hypothetical protein VCR5J5_1410001 [Vibrio crassostreae]|uniref:Uncharacterized protein n=1 Tax=Vibrio crassostreae TaxID=246167 RepID=A0A822MP88_9VIBR|nr:hypothetical protein VCR5J5_1410001 [Vibrio crassostreae]
MIITFLGNVQKSCSLKTLLKAPWQSGYAADCKSVDLGSTPGGASIIQKKPVLVTGFFVSGLAKSFLRPFFNAYQRNLCYEYTYSSNGKRKA